MGFWLWILLMDRKVIAYVGVGSNQGEREEYIRRAIEALGAFEPEVKVLRVSPLYETPPLVEGGVSPEEEHPEDIGWFLNGVIELETVLGPEALLETLQRIEKRMGRKRPGEERSGSGNAARLFLSRTIDLDLVFYGDEVIQTEALTVPHPRAHKRAFVMWPMRDLRAGYVHPVLGKTMGELCEGTAGAAGNSASG